MMLLRQAGVRLVGAASALVIGGLLLVAGVATASAAAATSGSPLTSHAGSPADLAAPVIATASAPVTTETPAPTTTGGANAPGRGHLIVVIATVAVGVGFVGFVVVSAHRPHETDSSP